MANDLFKHYIYPIATLSGSIIGVGFLSLPYIALKVGLLEMGFYVVLLTAVMVYLHLIFAQISLKTPDFKRFPGFVGYYLGIWPERITSALMILGCLGVLLIYLIVAGQFLTAIFSPIFGGTMVVYALVFFVVASAAAGFGITLISKIEFWALLLLSILFAIIFVQGFPKIQLENLFLLPQGGVSLRNLFLPYGAILFALWGTGLIPEVEEMMRDRKDLFKKIVVIATLLPAALYAIFIFFVLGITGSQTTESALTGLALFFDGRVITAGLAMGVLVIFVAFISQALLLKKTFMYDLGVKEFPAWVFTCTAPLILFLLGFNSFIPLISFLGGAVLGIDGILILLMYQKTGGKKVVIYPLIIFFILGIIYELIYFIH